MEFVNTATQSRDIGHDAEILSFARTPAHLRIVGVIPLILGVVFAGFALLPILGAPVSIKIGDLEREAAIGLFVPVMVTMAVLLEALAALTVWSD